MGDVEDIEYLLGQLKDRQPGYATLEAYYDGDQAMRFSTEAFRTAFARLFNRLSYNRVAAVVDAIADHLQVTGFDDESGSEQLIPLAEEIWGVNRMDRRQGEVHSEAPKLGDAYVIVDLHPDTGDPTIWPNSGAACAVLYDDERPGQVNLAVKVWRSERSKRWRINVYWPDATKRYVSTTARSTYPVSLRGFVPFDGDGEPDGFTHDWETVPVFHFANNGKTGCPGVSEVAGIIDLQDMMNHSLRNMLVTGEFHAWPQKWAVGVEKQNRWNDVLERMEEVQPFEFGVDRFLAVADKDAKFGQFDAAAVDGFTASQAAFDLYVSRVSRVPVHWLNPSGTPPSGESLKTLNAPFAKKIVDRQRGFGNVWEDVQHLCLRIKTGAKDVGRLQAIWEPAESRSEREFWEIARMKLDAGIPEEQIWAEAGYSAEQIADFMEHLEEKRAVAASAATMFGNALAQKGEEIQSGEDGADDEDNGGDPAVAA